jgi:hypothetical protein
MATGTIVGHVAKNVDLSVFILGNQNVNAEEALEIISCMAEVGIRITIATLIYI